MKEHHRKPRASLPVVDLAYRGVGIALSYLSHLGLSLGG